MSAVCTRCGVILHGLDKDGVVCEDCRKAEAIDRPAHYTAGKVECIDAIEAATEGLTGIAAVCTANVIKYVWRWHRKNGVEDLKKAATYLQWLINIVEKGDRNG